MHFAARFKDSKGLTEFDREAWRELHLYKLPEFIKVLEGCNHLQNIQQSAKGKTHNE